MNVWKAFAKLYAPRYYVPQLKRNFNTSTAQFVASLNADQPTTNSDGIYVYAKATQSLMSNYTNLACGHDFTVLAVGRRQLMVSGVNGNSQLGIPSSDSDVVNKLTKVDVPFEKSDSFILDISCGRLHTIVSTTEGLFATGCNKLGQCGLGEVEGTTSFTKIPWSTSVKQVVCGLDHTLVLTEDGDVWSCGWGADGQTGLRHTQEQRSLAVIQMPPSIKIAKVATKGDSCLAVTNSGAVLSWGNSEYRQLGFSTEETLIKKPTQITSLENQMIVDIAIGNSVALALTDEGDVFTWGYGLLGNSIEPCLSATPQKLTFLNERVVKVDCGLEHYVLLTGDKEMYMWGKLNQTIYSHLPKKVDLHSNVLEMGCGTDHLGIIVDDYSLENTGVS